MQYDAVRKPFGNIVDRGKIANYEEAYNFVSQIRNLYTNLQKQKEVIVQTRQIIQMPTGRYRTYEDR
jgi:hypothetical protein